MLCRFFADVFSAEAFIEFKRYISGLIRFQRTRRLMASIGCLSLISCNQSSLNRLLTVSPFALAALNQARLAVLASVPATHRKPKGVLSVDEHVAEPRRGRTLSRLPSCTTTSVRAMSGRTILVTLHYSDDDTDYPLLFQLWQPVDLAKLEQGLRTAQVPLKASKEPLKETAPDKWRSYLLGLWQRRQKQYPEIQDLYDSKLSIAQALLQQWVTGPIRMKRCRWSSTTGSPSPTSVASWTTPCTCRMSAH